MTKLIKGDIVTLRGQVTYVLPDDDSDENNISVKIAGYYQTVHLSPKDLTFVHHMFKVGDHVRGRRGANGNRGHAAGHVRAVNGDFAWVEYESSGLHATAPLRELELMPAPPDMATAMVAADADFAKL